MNLTRLHVRSDVLLAIVVTLGVVGSAGADWLQGQPPQSRIPGIAGFVPFLLCSLVCLGAAVQATDARRSPRWRLVSLGAAMAAAALADPTYAALLAVVPLIEIARRATEPERSVAIGAGAAFLGWLAVTEQSGQRGGELESVFVLVIVITIVVMFGNALRASDQARILEARLARVDERNRLASDIHDSLGHNLLASSIQLRSAQALMQHDPDAAADSIDLAARAVAEALAETRLVVDDARAEGGSISLESSLSGLVARVTTPEVPVALKVHGDHRALGSAEQMTLYRFVQETLSNVIRHADASNAVVDSRVADGTASVTVTDDGRGFDVDSVSERTGLANLRERLARHDGSMSVASERGAGTTVTAQVSVSA